ncbi:MAG: esterase-like activity of phytase family protein [Sphingomicrobium sp.]
MKSFLFSGLAVGAIVVAAHRPIERLPNRTPLPEHRVPIRFAPVRLPPQVAPLTRVGAWALHAADPRFDGISALAIEGSSFVAISDSGVVVRFPRPGSAIPTIELRDLPSGPGRADRKAGNDSEAIARDPQGRGWWVAFESIHQLRLYDRDFQRTLAVRPLDGRRWRENGGVEGLVGRSDSLLLVAEDGDTIERFDGRMITQIDKSASAGRLSDAALLPDGRILLLTRSLTPLGFRNGIALFDPERGTTTSLTRLSLGHLDNAEGIAAETLPGGIVRLWVVTDRDSRARGRTLLAAFDWKP